MSTNRLPATYDYNNFDEFPNFSCVLDKLSEALLANNEPPDDEMKMHQKFYAKQLKEVKEFHELEPIIVSMLSKNILPDQACLSEAMRVLRNHELDHYSHYLYDIILNNHLAVTETFNHRIQALFYGRYIDADSASRVMNEAIYYQLDDANTYKLTIKAIARSVDPDVGLALKLLNTAISSCKINKFTYKYTIDAIINKRKYPDKADLISILIIDARQRKVADAPTYNSVLRSISLKFIPDTKLALALLEHAKSEKLADDDTYQIVIRMLKKINNDSSKYMILSLLEERLKHQAMQTEDTNSHLERSVGSLSTCKIDSSKMKARAVIQKALPPEPKLNHLDNTEKTNSEKTSRKKSSCTFGLFAKSVAISTAVTAVFIAGLGL